MGKRAGKTKNYSISLGVESQRILQARARSAHDGNLSAAVAEAAELLRREMALADLARELEAAIGTLTDAARARVDREWVAPPPKRKRSAA
jgi:hypothetical protein